MLSPRYHDDSASLTASHNSGISEDEHHAASTSSILPVSPTVLPVSPTFVARDDSHEAMVVFKKLCYVRGRLSALYERSLSTHTQLEYEHSSLTSSLLFLQESEASLQQRLAHGLASAASDDTTSIGALMSTRQEDSDRSVENVNRITELDRQHSNLKVKMKKAENRFVKYGAELLKLLKPEQFNESNFHNVSVRPLSTSSLDSSQGSTSSRITLLDDYYRRAGDFGVHHERLINLQMAYDDDRARRDVLTDQGQQPEPSDTIFEDEYSEARAKIEQEVKAAYSDMERLKALCLENGIDPDDNRQGRTNVAATAGDDPHVMEPSPPANSDQDWWKRALISPKADSFDAILRSRPSEMLSREDTSGEVATPHGSLSEGKREKIAEWRQEASYFINYNSGYESPTPADDTEAMST